MRQHGIHHLPLVQIRMSASQLSVARSLVARTDPSVQIREYSGGHGSVLEEHLFAAMIRWRATAVKDDKIGWADKVCCVDGGHQGRRMQ